MSRRRFDILHGVLIVDKPAEMTSAAVVAEVLRRIGAKTGGHTGTLDPMATGVLPVCLGSATKLAPWFVADDKSYDVEVELGVETDTLDRGGDVVRRDAPGGAAITRDAMMAALTSLTGEYAQVPPAHSAIKRGGERLHALARAGIALELTGRPVRVDRLELLEFVPPRARLAMTASKGTYVRSLVRDLGARLGCGACVATLRRTASGRFGLSRAVRLDELDYPRAAAQLWSSSDALGLPAVVVADGLVRAVRDGRTLDPAELAIGIGDGLYQMVTERGDVLAVAERTAGGIVLHRVLAHAAEAVGAGAGRAHRSPASRGEST